MHNRRFLLPLFLAILLLETTCASRQTLPAQASSDLVVYADGLGTGWRNWSWGVDLNLSNSSPVHAGKASISAAYNKAWGGVYLHAGNAFNAVDYTAVRFWIHGGRSGGQQVAIKVIDDGNGNWENQVLVTPQADGWTQVTVDFAQVGSPMSIGALVWQDARGGSQPVFYLDDVTLVARTGPRPTPLPPTAGPDIQIDAAAARHAISPDIYGMSYADENLARDVRLPVRRWGGNAATRYNWQLDVHNTGSDWYFENIPDANSHPEQLPNGSSADRFVEQNQRTGADTLLTVPLIGWTPNRRLAGHPYDCGFQVSKYGAQKSTDPWDPNCGNGKDSNGNNLTGNNPADTSTAIGPDFVQAWIQHLIGGFGSAANGGVKFYNLDNEPMLWPYTHRDVHPGMTTYDEMRDRTYAYAAAIKAADPGAQTLGPVVWGWCAYFFSASDGCKPGPDFTNHANTPFVEWYLQQMRSYEQAHGTRILDYVDVHIYPQASGVHSNNPGNAATQALRLRSTRALWDPSYTDESWINQPVQLIPRMRQWVQDDYPGTKLAITEYSWGAQGYLNGALAQADILGIFGREGLDLATLWDPPAANEPGAFAFRMYRNYDGAGGAFGEISLRAQSADQDKLSVYAAQRPGGGALTVLVINKTGVGLTSTVSLANFTPAAAASVYRYSAEDLNAIQRQPDQAVGPGGITATFPASSITLIVIPSGGTPTNWVYLPMSCRGR